VKTPNYNSFPRMACTFRVAYLEKIDEKALIPLPPTGFASFFCAKLDVVQTNLQPKRAVGLSRPPAISQIAKF